jgi:pilus assembly protein CpaF
MWQIRKPKDQVSPEEVAERTEEDRRLMTTGDAGAFATKDLHTDLKVELHQRLLALINLSALDTMSREQIEEEVGDIVLEELDKQRHALNHAERRQLVDDVLDELLGLGPIEPLLKDQTITDILVNGHDSVFVERFGVLEPSPVRFKDAKHLIRIIQKIVSAVGRRVDESAPMVDARLADGSRVNAVVPPLALDGALLSIRKFAKTPISMGRLIEIGSVPAQVAEVLKAVVAARLNVLISGGTGSGKTTMLNAMSAFIDTRERIVTIEDSAELQLQQPHVARLETRPANIEGKGAIRERQLVINALRMRPDRIIVGEVRGAETLDMLQALNTVHEGSLVTVHANSPDDAIHRLETLATMSDLHIPFEALRDQINSAIHVIVQIDRYADGKRRIAEVAIVASTRRETFRLGTVVRFEADAIGPDRRVTGRFRHFPLPPAIDRRLELMGLQVPPEFGPEAELEQTPVRKAE